MGESGKGGASTASRASPHLHSLSKLSKDQFGVCRQFIDNLAENNVSFFVMAAYIILSRGVHATDGRRISTYDAPQISAKSGADDDLVSGAMEWLKQHKAIESVEVKVGKEVVKRWLLNDGKSDIFLPTLLIDGGGIAPLMSLYRPEIESEEEELQQTDHLVLLCVMYQFHDMELFGGVNPRAGLYRYWLSTTHVASRPIVNIINSDAAIFEVSGETELVYERFSEQALSYVINTEERIFRFLRALRQLLYAGFIYEVLQIWDANPNDPDEDEAIPLYTVYVHDPIAQEIDPSLQKIIQRVAYRLGLKDGYQEFTASDYERGVAVKFRYVADKQAGGYPLGIFRLKYRTLLDEQRVFVDAERLRADAWLRELQFMYYQQE